MVEVFRHTRITVSVHIINDIGIDTQITPAYSCQLVRGCLRAAIHHGIVIICFDQSGFMRCGSFRIFFCHLRICCTDADSHPQSHGICESCPVGIIAAEYRVVAGERCVTIGIFVIVIEYVGSACKIFHYILIDLFFCVISYIEVTFFHLTVGHRTVTIGNTQHGYGPYHTCKSIIVPAFISCFLYLEEITVYFLEISIPGTCIPGITLIECAEVSAAPYIRTCQIAS